MGVITLTAAGYGDAYPTTVPGRAFGILVAVLGVGFFALLASMLASGIIEHATEDARMCPHCGEEFEDEY